MSSVMLTGNCAAAWGARLAGVDYIPAFPITPQTEIIELLSGYEFSKGRVVLVESEHSAMGVCIGAALAGARSFTASSSNGLAYMTENIFAAG